MTGPQRASGAEIIGRRFRMSVDREPPLAGVFCKIFRSAAASGNWAELTRVGNLGSLLAMV